jgi:hypothetical protein
MFFDPKDGLRSYNYLRLGIVLAVIMLAAAIRYEIVRTPAWCDFQTSISGYYYTPVRAVFVGALVAIGLSLIVVKGEGLEDLALNLAGVLAPVVALVPTVNIGKCYSFESLPKPVVDGELQPWVVANVSNNLHALVVAGAVAVLFAAVFYLFQTSSENFNIGSEILTLIGLAVMVGLVVFGFFYLTEPPNLESVQVTHNAAAIAMFVFLALSAAINGWRLWGPEGLTRKRKFAITYWAIAGLMALTGIVILWIVNKTRIQWDHSVLVLEATEIGLFAVYWLVQTLEHSIPEERSSGPRVEGATT